MDSVIALVERIRELVDDSMKDAVKCDKGNRSAGVRLRKVFLEISETAKHGRKVVVEKRD